MKISKALDTLIKNKPKVFSMYFYENDAYELFLENGYQYNGLHAIAGNTVKEVLSQINDIEECPFDCVCRN